MDRCLCQIFRSKSTDTLQGHGDCSVCQTHPDNVNCKGYSPINITIIQFEVENPDKTPIKKE